MLESLEDVEFTGMEDMVDYLLPLMCGNVSAVLEDDKPAAALDMMVYPLSDHTHYTPQHNCFAQERIDSVPIPSSSLRAGLL